MNKMPSREFFIIAALIIVLWYLAVIVFTLFVSILLTIGFFVSLAAFALVGAIAEQKKKFRYNYKPKIGQKYKGKNKVVW